jgi:hypothetical protein
MGKLLYHPPDHFGTLWDDGVAEGSQTVQSMGNPINHSTKRGFRDPTLLDSESSPFEAELQPADAAEK